MLQLTQWIIEDYFDDLIFMARNPSRALLNHIARAIIISTPEFFVPPHTSGHNGGDLVAIKNLLTGEVTWCIEKWILGWIFNGLIFCISLLPLKVENLRKLIKETLNLAFLLLNNFQKIVGWLRHSAIGITASKGLFQPINTAL